MPNLIQSGAAWLGKQLQAAAGRTVKLEQGTAVIDGLTATATEFEYDVADAEGFLTKVLSYDWIFVAADLAIAGQRLELFDVGGTVLTETLCGVEQRYESMPVGDKPAWERKDSSGILIVLHTKKVRL